MPAERSLFPAIDPGGAQTGDPAGALYERFRGGWEMMNDPAQGGGMGLVPLGAGSVQLGGAPQLYGKEGRKFTQSELGEMLQFFRDIPTAAREFLTRSKEKLNVVSNEKGPVAGYISMPKRGAEVTMNTKMENAHEKAVYRGLLHEGLGHHVDKSVVDKYLPDIASTEVTGGLGGFQLAETVGPTMAPGIKALQNVFDNPIVSKLFDKIRSNSSYANATDDTIKGEVLAYLLEAFGRPTSVFFPTGHPIHRAAADAVGDKSILEGLTNFMERFVHPIARQAQKETAMPMPASALYEQKVAPRRGRRAAPEFYGD